MNKIVEKIQSENNFLILPHIHPDGDALGSAIALAEALRSLGKRAFVYNKDEIPYNLDFLSKEDFITKESLEKIGDYIVIALDSSDMGRIEDREFAYKNKFLINIDHHVTNTEYANLNYVDKAASSTGEIIYKLSKRLDVTLTEKMASPLYVAISTDTGNFKYSNTSSETHQIASDLLKHNIDIQTINKFLYHSIRLNKFRLNAKVLSMVEFYNDNKIAVMDATKKVMDQFECNNLDDIVESARDIESVELSILVSERNGMTKVSMRSKEYIDVAEISKSFGGGGHVRAAGFNTDMTLDETKTKTLVMALEAFNEWNSKHK